MKKSDNLSTKLLTELFSKDASDYLTKRSSNFTVVLLQDIPQRFPQFSGGILADILKNLDKSCHKSRTLKALNISSQIGDQVDKDCLSGVDKEMISLVEKFKTDADLLFSLVKCSKVLKFESVVEEVKKIFEQEKLGGKFNRVKSLLKSGQKKQDKKEVKKTEG